jgi:hypothetical protein
MRVTVGAGMVLLIAQLILKVVKNGDIWFRRRHFAVMNVVLASERKHSQTLSSSTSFMHTVVQQVDHGCHPGV